MEPKKETKSLNLEALEPGRTEIEMSALSASLLSALAALNEGTRPSPEILHEIVSRFNGMVIHFPADGREDIQFQDPAGSAVGVNVNLHYPAEPDKTGIAIGFHDPFIGSSSIRAEFLLDELECSLVREDGVRIDDSFMMANVPKTVCRFWAPTGHAYTLGVKLRVAPIES